MVEEQLGEVARDHTSCVLELYSFDIDNKKPHTLEFLASFEANRNLWQSEIEFYPDQNGQQRLHHGEP